MAKYTRENDGSGRVTVLKEVNNTLTFFVLVVLVIEAVLGGVVLSGSGQVQVIALYGMLFIIVLLVVIVSFFAFKKPDALIQSNVKQSELQAFAEALEGYWWEKVTDGDSVSLSFTSIIPDPVRASIRMKGTVYESDGKVSADWESVATCLTPDGRKVFYYWSGLYEKRPGESYEGFGEITFVKDGPTIDRGQGFFSNTNLTDLSETVKKGSRWRRSSPEDATTMRGEDKESIGQLVKARIG